VPFKPSNAGNHALSPYPVHESAGAAAAKSSAAAANDDGPQTPKLHARAWCHAASNHSGLTRSIVSMNI